MSIDLTSAPDPQSAREALRSGINPGGIYVATETYWVRDPEGAERHIRKGIDRARGAHFLVQNNPEYWEPVADKVQYDVETAAGEKRDAQLTTPASDTSVEVLSQGAPGERESAQLLATDAARAHALDKGVDLAAVTGTGPNGQIKKSDVEAHLAAKGS